MSEKKTASRRKFLKGSTAIAAGTALAGALKVNIARMAHAAGGGQIKVALIGCGGRGNGAINDCMTADNSVKVIAVADAFERQAKNAANRLRNEFKERADIPEERVFCGLDAFQKAIDSGPDMVILTTPPGFRPYMYAAAIKAGKNVFMEKPCCVDAAGFRILMETNKLADEKGLKVGVGFQRRHTPSYMETIKRIHDGAIGKLMVLRGYWNGDGIWVRRRKELAGVLGHEPTKMEYQINNWYHFCWLSGDNICEQHIHNLDVCNWAKNAHPVEANGMGGCSVRYSGDNKGVGQIFDHHFVEFTYADGTKLYSQCRHIPGVWINVSEAASGTEGQSNCAGWIKGKEEWHFNGKNVNAMVQEHKDLINAIGSSEKYNEGYYGATSSMTAVFGRMATYSGQALKWEDAVAKGTTEFPATLAWDAKAPVEPDKDGNYPIPVPGVYKPYA
jgi:myo-inositol 2-dehydrogenase / D-chiro-inositol 1-dehydrogenase